MPPGGKAPVRTGRLQARIAGPEEESVRRREPAGDSLGGSQSRIKGFIGGWEGKDRMRIAEARTGKLPGGEITILFLPTEEDSIALGALRRLKDRKVVDPGRILVFCAETKKTLFESQPEVSEVIVYQPGQNWKNIRTILELAMMRVDIVVAILSPRPIFRAHKRLFRILPARARLVFNEHGDCYYATRSFQDLKHTFRDLLELWNAGSMTNVPIRHRHFWRKRFQYRVPGLGLVKALLFFPRYLFLILWLLAGCLRPGGSKRLVVLPTRKLRPAPMIRHRCARRSGSLSPGGTC